MAGQRLARPDLTFRPTARLWGRVKIPCNLVINGGETVTINGPIWVAGDITLGNGSIIKLAPAFGGLSTTVIADDPGQSYNQRNC